jgi:peptide/nickel transport system permease protein
MFRLGQALLSLWVVSVVVFGLGRITGDPVSVLLPIDATHEEREQLREELGFNEPIWSQYGTYMRNSFRGQFGESIKYPDYEAMGLVITRFPTTIKLAVVAILFSIAVAIPIGVLSAVKKDSIYDWMGKTIALLGQSFPPFWLGLVMMWIFAVQLELVPTSQCQTVTSYILPAITIGWFLVAALMRLMRSSMLEILDSEYINLARTKGLRESKVVWKHAVRNAAIAPLTYFGIILGSLLVGSVTVETVFAWPGLGYLVFEAVIIRDYPLVQAVVLIFSVLFIVVNLFVDILYAYLDPRIRYQ